PRQQGKQRSGEVGWYGQQSGKVMLSDRKLAVQRPRLRQRGPGADKEVEIPAYAAMQDEPRMGARMLDILMRGVSTRQYRSVTRGVNPEQKRLFVIDGSKALRTAINAVFGNHPVQRCRAHKLRNVMDYLPEDQKDQVKSAMRAAWRLDAKGGMARMKKLAEWLERDYPSAAASLIEGLEECFTINRLDVPASLHRCLATTNVIESPHAGVRMRTRRVCRWRDSGMVKRWMASALLATEKNFRKIMGYRDLWTLDAILNGSKSVTRREVA